MVAATTLVEMAAAALETAAAALETTRMRALKTKGRRRWIWLCLTKTKATAWIQGTCVII